MNNNYTDLALKEEEVEEVEVDEPGSPEMTKSERKRHDIKFLKTELPASTTCFGTSRADSAFDIVFEGPRIRVWMTIMNPFSVRQVFCKTTCLTLYSVTLTNVGLTDSEAWKIIMNCPRLTSLKVAWNQITDEGFRLIANCFHGNLVWLSVINNPISDRGSRFILNYDVKFEILMPTQSKEIGKLINSQQVYFVSRFKGPTKFERLDLIKKRRWFKKTVQPNIYWK